MTQTIQCIKMIVNQIPMTWQSIESATERLSASPTEIASSKRIFWTAFSHSFNFLEASGSFGQIFFTQEYNFLFIQVQEGEPKTAKLTTNIYWQSRSNRHDQFANLLKILEGFLELSHSKICCTTSIITLHKENFIKYRKLEEEEKVSKRWKHHLLLNIQDQFQWLLQHPAPHFHILLILYVQMHGLPSKLHSNCSPQSLGCTFLQPARTCLLEKIVASSKHHQSVSH